MPPKAKFTRDEIIAAAMQIVRRDGMDALTARSLGTELSSSSAPIFTVFSGMDEVKGDVIAAAKALYKSYVEAGFKETPAFKGVGTAYIRFAKEEPKFFALLFMSHKEVPEENELLPILDESHDAILEIVARDYNLSPEAAAGLYLNIFIFTHGIATLCATGVYKFTDGQISGLLTQAFISLLKELKK